MIWIALLTTFGTVGALEALRPTRHNPTDENESFGAVCVAAICAGLIVLIVT